MTTIRNVNLRQLMFLASRMSLNYEACDVTLDDHRNILSFYPVEASSLHLLFKESNKKEEPKSDRTIGPDTDINDLIGG